MRIYATCLGDAAQRLSLHDEKERNWMCSLCVPLRSKQRNFFSRFRFCHHFVLIDACSEVWLCVASILFASCHHGLGVKAHGESDRECIAANIVGNGRDKKMQKWHGMCFGVSWIQSNYHLRNTIREPQWNALFFCESQNYVSLNRIRLSWAGWTHGERTQL